MYRGEGKTETEKGARLDWAAINEHLLSVLLSSGMQ